jgi:hypothetical protein
MSRNLPVVELALDGIKGNLNGKVLAANKESAETRLTATTAKARVEILSLLNFRSKLNPSNSHGLYFFGSATGC